MECYIPNNPQYGEYLQSCGPACDIVHCACQIDLGDERNECCQQQEPQPDCCDNDVNTLADLSTDVLNEQPWSEEMGSFSLPPLELDPLPSMFPFSPCSGYRTNSSSDCRERNAGGGDAAADVLLSLKHAVVHGDCSPETVHPQMMVNGGSYPYYEHYGGAPPIFPTMSVNVSMNMTMHGCAPDQLCPQVQWNQNSTPAVNVVYPQTQPLNPTYPSATYSFTADFRPQQSDPLITAPSYKPMQNKPQGNYYLGKPCKSPRKCDRKMDYLGQPIQDDFYPSCVESPGKVQIGSLSCSDDDEQKPNLCRICGKTYARPSTLKTHLRTHSGERPYRCVDCNKSFSQAANLTAHVRTHTGQKPFRCPICDRRFSQSSSVTTHMRTHSGERPYQCRSCKKAFSDSSTLTKHLRIHSGEKPYQCKLCLLRFSQSGNLNRHMRVHGNIASGMIG